jgi:hypothetical protein
MPPNLNNTLYANLLRQEEARAQQMQQQEIQSYGEQDALNNVNQQKSLAALGGMADSRIGWMEKQKKHAQEEGRIAGATGRPMPAYDEEVLNVYAQQGFASGQGEYEKQKYAREDATMKHEFQVQKHKDDQTSQAAKTRAINQNTAEDKRQFEEKAERRSSERIQKFAIDDIDRYAKAMTKSISQGTWNEPKTIPGSGYGQVEQVKGYYSAYTPQQKKNKLTALRQEVEKLKREVINGKPLDPLAVEEIANGLGVPIDALYGEDEAYDQEMEANAKFEDQPNASFPEDGPALNTGSGEEEAASPEPTIDSLYPETPTAADAVQSQPDFDRFANEAWGSAGGAAEEATVMPTPSPQPLQSVAPEVVPEPQQEVRAPIGPMPTKEEKLGALSTSDSPADIQKAIDLILTEPQYAYARGSIPILTKRLEIAQKRQRKWLAETIEFANKTRQKR